VRGYAHAREPALRPALLSLEHGRIERDHADETVFDIVEDRGSISALRVQEQRADCATMTGIFHTFKNTCDYRCDCHGHDLHYCDLILRDFTRPALLQP
jgi:hypothetical protein